LSVKQLLLCQEGTASNTRIYIQTQAQDITFQTLEHNMRSRREVVS